MDIYDVILKIRPAYRALERAVAAGLEGLVLGVGERAVLEVLVTRGPSTLPAIAGELRVTRQFAQRMAKHLRMEHLCEAAPNPVHKRSMLLRATDAGVAMFAEIHLAERRALAPLEARLRPEDVEAAHRVLSALAVHFADPDGSDVGEAR